MTTQTPDNPELHSLQTKLGIYESKINEIEEKIKRQKPGSDARADNIIKDLKLKKKLVETQVQLAKEKGVTALNEVGSGLKKAWNELNDSVEAALRHFQ